MSAMRTAKVVYLVHATNGPLLARGEIAAVLGRHPVPTGHAQVVPVDAEAQPDLVRDWLPTPKEFSPPLDFDVYARLRQARCVYRVEVSECEPESLAYLRQAMLVAGELAAMSDGLIVDAIALATLTAHDVLSEIERPFDPLRHVNVHVDRGERPHFVHTHGLEKFGHADFELHGIPRDSLEVARRLLRQLTAAVVSGGCYQAGEESQLLGLRFRFTAPEPDERHCFSGASLRLEEFRLAGGVAAPDLAGMLTS